MTTIYILLFIIIHLILFGISLLIAKNGNQLYTNDYGWKEINPAVVILSLFIPYITIVYFLAVYSKPTRNICPLCSKKSTGEFKNEIEFYKEAERIQKDTEALMKKRKELFNF